MLDKAIRTLARVMALSGGLVLTALILMTAASVSGRALIPFGLGPIPGDFELVEAGTGFAVFAFLPWCHLNRGHASVEILTMYFGTAANRLIDVVADALMLAVAALIARQHWLGTVDKFSYGETSFILQYPVWWAYGAAMVGAAVFVIVSAYCLYRSLAALTGHRPPLRGGGEA